MTEKPVDKLKQTPDLNGDRKRLGSSKEDAPSFSSDDLSCIGDYLSSEIGKKECRQIRRGDILPHLFKLRGEPMSLENHIQFHALYPHEYAADTLILAGRQVGKCVRVFSKSDTFAMRHANGCRAKCPAALNSVIAARNGNTNRRFVSAVMRPGVKRILHIHTYLGSDLFVTPEHRIMQPDGNYITAGELVIGSNVCKARKCYKFGTCTESKTFIRMTASMVGCQTKIPNKQIPDWVFDLDERCTSVFIEKLWEDGGLAHCSHGTAVIKYTTPYALLASDLSALLSKYGILTRKTTNYTAKMTPVYTVTVEGETSFSLFVRTFNVGINIDDVQQYVADETDTTFDTVEVIDDVGTYDTFDITVDGPEHNFVLDGIVVHNSLNLSRAEVLDCLTIPELQLLYVAPLQSQAQRYSTLYLNEAIKSCELARINQMKALEGLWSDAKILTAVGHQSFANGSGIQLTYAKTSPDRARGIFADIIDFDEVQDQLTDNIPIISQSTKSSTLGLRRFTGTAKTVDNTIEGLWQSSSQCEWAMHCTHCNAWNIPNQDGRVLDMIQADGMHCVECGGKLNVRNGEWVPAHPNRMKTFRGYHIPQVILPFHTENMDNWGKIIRDVMSLPVPVILQEILGISCSQGQRIIDQNTIDRQSVLPSMFTIQNELHRYAFTVGAIDWGGAEQVSFTVHTIIGVCGDGTLDVIWARRYQGFDPDEMLTEIAKTNRFYGVRICAADYGMGFDKNVMLESRFGLPIIQIQLCKQNALMNYSPALGHPRWMVDKTTALDLMFMAIKYGKIRFPPKEEFEIYTKDLLSPYEEVVDHGEFAHRRFVRDPARPDDFAMALCFGTMAAIKLQHSELTDLIPRNALHAEAGKPTYAPLDPAEILKALNS